MPGRARAEGPVDWRFHLERPGQGAVKRRGGSDEIRGGAPSSPGRPRQEVRRVRTPAVQPAPRKRRSRPPARLVRRGTGRPPRPGRLPALRSRRRARRGAGRRRRHGRRARPGGAELRGERHPGAGPPPRRTRRHVGIARGVREGGGAWFGTVADPDGNYVQLIQLTPDYWAQRRARHARSEGRGAALRVMPPVPSACRLRTWAAPGASTPTSWAWSRPSPARAG